MVFYKDYVDEGSMYGWSYVFEEDDGEYIRTYVEENIPEYFDGEGSEVVTIPFYNPYTDDDFEIEVTLSEWL